MSSTDTATDGVRSRNTVRKTTIQLEEGVVAPTTSVYNEKDLQPGSSNSGGGSGSDLTANGGRRRLSRDQSDSRSGLGGHGVPPRRATMDSGAGGRDLRR